MAVVWEMAQILWEARILWEMARIRVHKNLRYDPGHEMAHLLYDE